MRIDRMANIVKAFFKWFFLILTVFSGLLMLVLLMAQLPHFKAKLTSLVLDELSELTDHQLSIDEIEIDWLDRVSIKELTIHDRQDSLMLKASNLTINYSFIEIINSRSLYVESVKIHGGNLNLLKHHDSSGVNLNVFLASLSKGANVEKQKPSISLGEIHLDEFSVGYRDLRFKELDTLVRVFSPIWFDFQVNNMEARDFILKNDSLSLDIISMSGMEKYSTLPVSTFSTNFGLYPKAIIMDDLLLETNRSHISDSLVLEYERPGLLVYMRDSVKLTANLNGSRISLNDVEYFSSIDLGDDLLEVSGIMSGKISNLDLKNFHILTEAGSYVNSDVSLIGLPYVSETFMDIRVTSSEIQPYDLNRFISANRINPGVVKFKGDLLGFVNDIVATGTFENSMGRAISDLNLKVANDPSASQYRGSLKLDDFDVGRLIGNKEIGHVNFNGSVNGKGFNASLADLQIDAIAWNSEFSGHQYDTIKVNGRFKSNFFDGYVKVSDDWVRLEGNSTIDFATKAENINLDLVVDTLDLYAYKIAKIPTIYSSKVQADLHELNPDEMSGSVSLQDVLLKNKRQTLELEQLKIIAKHDAMTRNYILDSDIAKVEISGDFLITQLLKHLPATLSSYMQYFSLTESPPKNIVDDDLKYEIDMDVELRDINPLLELFASNWKIADNTRLEASLSQQNDASFFLFAEVDTIWYDDRIFYGNSLEINASKDADSTGVLALVQLTSDVQQWNDKIQTQGINLETIWSNNIINNTLRIEQRQNQNKANLKSRIQLLQDTIDFKILPSRLQIFNTDWKISKDNLIRFLKDKWLINDIELYNGQQSVSIGGVLSDSFLTQVMFDFRNFDLRNISTLMPRSVLGVVDASGRISRLNRDRPLRFESDVDISNLLFEDVLVGDLSGYSEWDKEANGLYLDYSIKRQSVSTIDLDGYYRPFDDNPLALNVEFDGANLNLIEPLFSFMVSKVGGSATGELSITGTPSRPVLRGLATIRDGRATINYLNTDYRFDGVTRFFENQIAFDNIKVQDRLNHNAILNGVIGHKQFTNFNLNIDMGFQDFELLNTTQQQNSLYYGTAYATGNMKMIGPAENLLIKAVGTSSKDTKIYIPLVEESGVEQESFITFSQKGVIKNETKNELNLTGVSIDFDMNITPDAYIELIFNPRTGDIIRGRGNGNLQLTVNSSGDFDLFGNYTVSEGAYNFTTANGLVNKEFQVQSGGTISWFGDPYEGQMDITAVYRQLADITDWQPTANTDQSTNVSQKRPVLVVLDLDGSMLTPDITYKLQLADETNVSITDTWIRDLATINANDEELKRQVFSLLILRRFSERDGFVVGSSSVGQGLNSSLGELIGNQLSYWVNQMDENLEVDFDINQLGTDAFNTFQLRLAYSFLDGRLRVTRGGGVTTIVEEGSPNDVSNILGDWTVEYVLTKDGKWRMRFFSRNNQYGTSTATNTTLSQGQENGLSLQYVTSFDEFSQIIRSGRKEEDTDEVSPTSGEE